VLGGLCTCSQLMSRVMSTLLSMRACSLNQISSKILTVLSCLPWSLSGISLMAPAFLTSSSLS